MKKVLLVTAAFFLLLWLVVLLFMEVGQEVHLILPFSLTLFLIKNLWYGNNSTEMVE